MVLSNNEISKRFSDGNTKGESNNMFIENSTVYSYGRHFPISKRITLNNESAFLFNSNGYSKTTAGHKSHVLSALYGSKIIKLYDCDLNSIHKQIEANTEAINSLNNKIPRVRKVYKKEIYEESIKEFEDQNNLLYALAIENNLIIDAI